MGRRKNPAAVALGSRSWKGLNKAERSERARKTREKQLADTTKAERSEIMRALVKRRWKAKPAAPPPPSEEAKPRDI